MNALLWTFSAILLSIFVLLHGGSVAASETVAASDLSNKAESSSTKSLPSGDPSRESKPDVWLPANLIRLPLTRQATSYTCGVAALQSVLDYFGDEYREDDLAKKLKANYHDGTAYAHIVHFSENLGYHVDVHKDMTLADLKSLLDQHKPVICLIQAWSEHRVDYGKDWADGHYVVAIGYDPKNIFFMDPSTSGNYAFIPTEEFVERWHDTDLKEKLNHFGMVVLKDKSTYHPDAAKFME